MTRYPSALLALALLGCAGPAPSRAPLVRLSPAPASAFAVAPEALRAAPQVWKLKADALDLLGAELQDFPALRLLPEDRAPSVLQRLAIK